MYSHKVLKNADSQKIPILILLRYRIKMVFKGIFSREQDFTMQCLTLTTQNKFLFLWLAFIGVRTITNT